MNPQLMTVKQLREEIARLRLLLNNDDINHEESCRLNVCERCLESIKRTRIQFS